MKKQVRGTLIGCAILLAFSFLLESFVFNMLYWKTKTYQRDVVSDTSLQMSSNIRSIDDYLTVDLSADAGELWIPVENRPVLSLGLRTEGIKDNFSHSFGSPYSIGPRYVIYTNYVPILIEEVDAEGKTLYSRESFLYAGGEGTQYFDLEKDSNVAYIKVIFLYDEYLRATKEFFIKSIALNERKEFSFSPLRFSFVFIFLVCLFFLRPGSFLWKKSVVHSKGFLFLLPLITLLFFIAMGTKNPAWWDGTCFVDSYGELTKSLAKGQTYISAEPDASLLQMENPYDYVERIEKNVDFLLDYAYFNGKYYVYFGIFPALLCLPYYLVTGKMLSYTFLFFSGLFLLLLGISFSLSAYLKRYRYAVPVAEQTLLFFLWVILADIPYLFYCGFNYVFPQLFGMLFVSWGIYFYIKAGQECGNSCGSIIAGSLCMAFTLGCRPQLVLCALLAFPLMKKRMCRKGTMKQWIAFLVPFVVIALPVMFYNYIRFGKVTDFGVRYNLTLGEIYNFKLSAKEIWNGLQFYLFSPFMTENAFPWFMTHIPSGYAASATVTEIAAGSFLRYPILIVSVFSLLQIQKKKEESLLQGVLLGLTIIMVAVASFYLGIRYVFDYAFLLGFFATVSYNKMVLPKQGSRIKRVIIIGSVFAGILGGILYYFTKNLNTSGLYYFNRDFWVYVKNLVEFWKV